MLFSNLKIGNYELELVFKNLIAGGKSFEGQI